MHAKNYVDTQQQANAAQQAPTIPIAGGDTTSLDDFSMLKSNAGEKHTREDTNGDKKKPTLDTFSGKKDDYRAWRCLLSEWLQLMKNKRKMQDALGQAENVARGSYIGASCILRLFLRFGSFVVQ